MDSLIHLAEETALIQKNAGLISPMEYLQIAQLESAWLLEKELIRQNSATFNSQLELYTQHEIGQNIASWVEQFDEGDATKTASPIQLIMAQKKVELGKMQYELEKKNRWPKGYVGVNAMTIQGYQNVTGQDVYFNAKRWFPTVGVGLTLPSAPGNKGKNAEMAQIEWKISESQFQWQKNQHQLEKTRLLEQKKSLIQVLNELKKQRMEYHEVALSQWNLQFKTGNIDAVAWIQQIQQWKDFYPTYVGLCAQFYQTQYELQKMEIHEK